MRVIISPPSYDVRVLGLSLDEFDEAAHALFSATGYSRVAPQRERDGTWSMTFTVTGGHKPTAEEVQRWIKG